MNSQERDLIFERARWYFLGFMEDSEKADFENQIKEDPEIADLVDLYSYTHQAIEVERKERLRGMIVDELGGGEQIEFTPKWQKASLWIAAAVLLLVFGVFVWILVGNKQEINTYRELYTENAQPYLLEERGGNSNLDRQFNQAGEAYANKDFQEAIKGFREVLADSIRNPEEARLYLGIALLESDSTQAGISQLSIVSEGYSVFKPQGRWYLALGYIKLEDKTNALATLYEIVQADQGYKKEAVELIGELERIRE